MCEYVCECVWCACMQFCYRGQWGYQVSCFIIICLILHCIPSLFSSFSTPSLPSEQAPAIPSPISHRLMWGYRTALLCSVFYTNSGTLTQQVRVALLWHFFKTVILSVLLSYKEKCFSKWFLHKLITWDDLMKSSWISSSSNRRVLPMRWTAMLTWDLL